MTLKVIRIEQQDSRLGRQVVHDERSRGFPMRVTVDRSTWRTKSIRIYDPLPNPNQCHGECTGCQKSMEFNAVGNRVMGKVFNMDDAHKFYSASTAIDPWEGTWPPTDTGSSGLAACQVAQNLGYGGEYRWYFGGIDECLQAVMDGITVGLGTWWLDGMFNPSAAGVIEPTGSRVGGHQYLLRGYDLPKDMAQIRCWWGEGFRDVWIRRTQLGELLADDGDAHSQKRLIQ